MLSSTTIIIISFEILYEYLHYKILFVGSCAVNNYENVDAKKVDRYR